MTYTLIRTRTYISYFDLHIFTEQCKQLTDLARVRPLVSERNRKFAL
jgi:hypothetical protein